MSVDERQLLATDGLEDDPEQALARLTAGVGVLERGLQRPVDDGDDHELLMTSLALSLQRLARDAAAAGDVTDDQRRRLADAAGRIRSVIDEMAARERRRLRAVAEPQMPQPVAQESAAAEPVAAAGPVTVPASDHRRHVMRLAGIGLIALAAALALFLLLEFTYTDVLQARSQRALLSEFRTRLAVGQFDDPAAPVQSGPVAVLRAPEIGLDQVVVQGSSPTSLKQGPGHLPGSPLPGEFGNAIVFGHRLTYGEPFSRLHELAKGDKLEVLTGQGRFQYRVTDVRTVKPGDDDVTGRSADSRMTLITSTSATSSDRLAVTATLVGNPVGLPTRPPAAAGSDEFGTVGDVAGLYLALLWLVALAAAFAATVVAYRRWPRRAAYLVTTPVLLMLLVLVFQNLDRFLPGTL